MPTVLRIGAFRFHFFSDEGDEPAHIHVDTGDGECKFWLDPVVSAKSVMSRQPMFGKLKGSFILFSSVDPLKTASNSGLAGVSNESRGSPNG